MDLKETLKDAVNLEHEIRADNRLVYLLGLFGLVVVVVGVWVMLTDWRSSNAAEYAADQGGQVIEELVQPIDSIKRVMTDEQVQSLAVRALNDPEKTGDLFAYVNGRMSQVSAVRVFPADLSEIQVMDLGPNGFALFDMIHSALEGNRSLLQIHNVLNPPMMFDATAIQEGGETIGVLVIELPPDYLLAGFNPDVSSLGVVRLTQYNGRQPLNVLREFGDTSLLGEVPERIAVRGTLFRLEYPQMLSIELITGGMMPFIFLSGVICLAAAVFLFTRNRKTKTGDQSGKADAAKPVRRKQPVLGSPESAQPEVVRAKSPPEALPEPAAQAAGKPEPVVNQADADIADPPSLHLQYDIAERRRTKEAEHAPVELTPDIFRAYDIRGVIDKTLDSGVARNIGQAVGSLALEQDASPVVVARDGRLSGPYLMDGMIEGILSTGCDVMDIGAVPTGVLYYAAFEMGKGSGVMITGSHNPPDYNGFKIMIDGDTLHGEMIQGIYSRISNNDLKSGEGKLTTRNVVPDYIERIAGDIQVEKPLRVVIDCGNGIGGVCAADTLRATGVEVLPLFDEVDGTFPNHHPDPSEPENLKDLIDSVRIMDADLGLAFDGDADRLGVVTLAGNIIFPDRVMMLLAMDVLDRNPGATILYDVKCTGHLPDVIRQAGGVPMMYKTGHSLMKAKMKEIGSPFAGEMSGHFFFKERWYGVDDGIYAAARLLEILGGIETPPEAILNALPTSFSTPELKVHMQEGENHGFVETFKAAAKFEDARISTIDGLRADFDDGWGLVRASNTTPILVVRFDAESEEALERVKGIFRSQMLAVNPDLDLPF